jgi:hypothetical protein
MYFLYIPEKRHTEFKGLKVILNCLENCQEKKIIFYVDIISHISDTRAPLGVRCLVAKPSPHPLKKAKMIKNLRG